jgi:two-component system KDP operon response regulator KdpE
VPLEVVAGGLKIELATKRVSLEGERVSLSPKEWKLLQELSLSAGQVVSHQRLLAAGWSSRVTDHQYLRIYIGLLRQKLEADASRPVHLLTEPGIGYRLAAPAGFEVEVRFA